jgi:hypothetical protein
MEKEYKRWVVEAKENIRTPFYILNFMVTMIEMMLLSFLG